jgi:serine/threonine-protein kinase HipA
MRDIIQFLKGSDAPDQDIATFMRACILFWMLGATDGHAKNFSITLGPGGRFRLTPLYDVLTAQPSLDAGQIQQKKFKLAMSVGKNCHYPVDTIMPRHFLQAAELAGVGTPLMRTIFEDLAANVEKQTDAVIATLPRGFPDQLIKSVRAAVKGRSALLTKTSEESADT